jgi:hypothetical protein
MKYELKPGRGNKISKNYHSPISDKNSDFYVPPDMLQEFMKSDYHAVRKSPLFKRARYVFIYKEYEHEIKYRLRGTYRVRRIYSIAILTDDNILYYNYYCGTHTVLSEQNVADFLKVFVNGYIWDENTRILLDNEIRKKSEPILQFMMILARIAGVKIRKRNVIQMMNSLNMWNDLDAIHSKTVSKKNRKRLAEKLIERGYFDFVPQHMLDVIQTPGRETERKRNAMFFACMGILYNHQSAINNEKYRNTKEILRTIDLEKYRNKQNTGDTNETI